MVVPEAAVPEAAAAEADPAAVLPDHPERPFTDVITDLITTDTEDITVIIPAAVISAQPAAGMQESSLLWFLSRYICL